MAELSDTQQKLLDIGKKEFLEKGFRNASLRGIVKEAGFTLGAFYGYYPDKETLFDALVAPAADALVSRFKEAQDKHFDLIEQENTAQSRQLSTEYLIRFVNDIYDNYDAFKLIICFADGTKYQNFIHELVELEVRVTEKYYRKLKKLGKIAHTVSKDVHHMLTSAYFTAVFEVVAHDMSRAKALRYVRKIAMFFNCGWDGILKIQ